MKKILLVKLASLGDVMVSTPFPRLIKQCLDDTIVDHMVMDHCKVVTASNPYVDKQINVEFLPSGNKWIDFLRICRVARKITHERYDVAIIFHRSLLFQILCYVCGVKKIYGFSSGINPFFAKHIPFRFDINRTEQEAELLRLSGINIAAVKNLEFYPDNCTLSPSLNVQLPNRFIACNPGGGNPHSPADNRMWPIEHYAELINSTSMPFVILGNGSGDESLVNKLLKLADNERVINLVNKTSFSETALILKKADIYLGNDSSLMFLAAAMGIATIGLYGPTQEKAACPIGTNQTAVISTAECAPCYDPYDGIKGRMYTCANNICMQTIEVNEVLKKIDVILKKTVA